jgi:hypothetical protein
MSNWAIQWRLDAANPTKEPEDAWQERGEYLLKISGCGMCHTPYYWFGPGGEPFSGGMRVRWNNVLQERLTFNITPDPETGLGNWSERDFIIAMKTGIYPDGTVAHWQAMPWDMHGNWSLDDLRAMYRYLMSLKPVKQKDPNPIEGPLPTADTFYFGT